MTSEVEALKTNEFLRRRKLRIQQVREQSKDIAKKIRQRASAEKFRRYVDLNTEQGRQYLEQQDKLVKKLEQLYAKSLDNIGASHKKAAEVTHEGDNPPLDLSKQRGRVAATELRRQKQEKLDERKKSLDRKLIAREIANEISRDKSGCIASKLKLQTVKTTEEGVQVDSTEAVPEQTSTSDLVNEKEDPKVTSDMATQWNYEPVPNEWEPHIPVLSLPKDDTKESSPKSKSNRSKRPNLFALSDEMPSSLRGGLASVPEETSSVKPSLTLVSDYIQNRDLRLREPDAIPWKPSEDLQRIRQTIMRTRAAKTPVSAKSSNVERPLKVSQPSHPDSILNKKSSVTMYNHSTRDIKDVPYGDKKLVIRDSQDENDAYSQAMRESVTEVACKEKEHQKKLQEMRNKIAVTKQNVDKEYKDTMTFLKTLSKEKTKPIRSAYKDDYQQQIHRDCRQRKLQSEFRKIQKECKKHPHNMGSNVSSHQAKSPVNVLSDDEIDGRDFQYSWMPVPESDGSLAIHTIPTTLKEQKSGNSVKFSKVDSYHEYRSRHKHTPPTKDVSYHENQKEMFISEQNDDGSGSSASDTSSVENLRLSKKPRQKKHSDDSRLSDTERIIIYKILDTKADKREKCSKSSSTVKDIAKSLSLMTKDRVTIPSRQEENDIETQNSASNSNKHAETRVSFEHLKEGIYKTVNETGDNVSSVNFADCPQKQSQLKEQSNENNYTGVQKSFVDRNCGCDMDALKVQSGPSATTSTSSFKTATNDKATSLLEADLKMTSETAKPSDAGFMKFVDDKGHDAGKFYIGASGFLKDDAYEVIIQLRKKDGTQVDSKEIQNEVADKTHAKATIEHEPAKDDNIPWKTFETLDKRVQCPEVVEHGSTENNNLDYNISMNPKVSDNIANEQFVQKVEFTDIPSQSNRADSQGVCTSAQESYVIPSNFTKLDLDTKPANSVSTQTTLGSPQRPVFIQMSSSTSTAYMSPPEFILPAFLKHNRVLDSISDDLTELPYEQTRVGNMECYENDDCDFEQYIPARRSPVSNPKGVRSIPSLTKIKQVNRKFRAPPNTARSTSSGYEDRDTYNTFRKKLYLINSVPKTVRKCTKCEKQGHSKLCLKSHHRKSRPNISTNRDPDRKYMKQVNSSLSRHKLLLGSSNYTQIDHRKLPRKELTPMVKWYVDKLLKMNKQGLRAIDVANQECSAVSTPGSSIIGVPQNIDKSKPTVVAKISLEQIKETIAQQVLEKCENEEINFNPDLKRHKVQKNSVHRIPRKKSLHKVKSLNISRKLVSGYKESWRKPATQTSISTSDTLSPKHDGDFLRFEAAIPPKAKGRSKSSPSPRRTMTSKLMRKNNSSDIIYFKSSEEDSEKLNDQNFKMNKARKQSFQQSEASADNYKDFKPVTASVRHPKSSIPLSTSTQTSQAIDEEITYIKLAESKLQNMEKIADLTEKCTQRLSNLAKVLDEVRKNRSMVYSQVSDTGSDTDKTSVKNSETQLASSRIYEPVIEIKEKNTTPPQIQSPVNKGQVELQKSFADAQGAMGFVPFLKDIPKPKKNSKPASPEKLRSLSVSPSRFLNTTPDHHSVKARAKPPPALSRRGLKHGPEILVPHELSTVIEVDSPLSSKLKSNSVRNESNSQVLKAQDENIDNKLHEEVLIIEREEERTIQNEKNQQNETINQNNNPDLLQSNASLTRSARESKLLTTDSSDESKLQMMDLNKFNEIMLKPFISIQEYAKQYNMGNLVETSNVENMTKEREDANDELSSLHSDGSLPDVIAELLKRNIINEPFKFDTASNVNSTTVSSDSTLSALALSKPKKDKKKSSAIFSNKENVETSDTLSISSNPDLENAFKKLGMGWASSTLKKTKERLALSSSSNTSSSSLSQYKLKTTNNQQFPALVTDSMSTSNAPRANNSKNVEQQTSMVNTMTVKQFLTKELAKKITFANKSRRDDTEEEFISLYETKMPDDINRSSKVIREDRSLDSNNRARTSTPVQIFKSMNYNSSSSSNMSNCLFSNADDLSSVKGTSNSVRNHSTSEKDDLTIPNFSLRTRKGVSDSSKSDD